MPKFLILVYGLLSFCSSVNSQSSFEKSEIYYLDGKYKKALNYIDQAIEENGDSAKYYSLKADISLILHEDRDECFLLMNKATDLEPENASLLLARAFVYKLFREYNNAILDYNRALDRANTDSLKVLVYACRGGRYENIDNQSLEG